MTSSAQPSRLADSFQFLRKSEQYRQAFENALAGRDPNGLEVPWYKRKKQFFWKYYLAGPALERVSGRQAWEHVVPLRVKLPLTVKDWKKGIVTVEGFYYPTGWLWRSRSARTDRSAWTEQ